MVAAHCHFKGDHRLLPPAYRRDHQCAPGTLQTSRLGQSHVNICTALPGSSRGFEADGSRSAGPIRGQGDDSGAQLKGRARVTARLIDLSNRIRSPWTEVIEAADSDMF